MKMRGGRVWSSKTHQAAAGGSCEGAEVSGTGQEASVRAPERLHLRKARREETAVRDRAQESGRVITHPSSASTSLSSFLRPRD